MGAGLLKRVFDIDMERCPNCGAGELKIIAAILERPVIERILTHLGLDPQPPPRRRVREAGQDFATWAAPAVTSSSPRLQRQTAAEAASRDASVQHHRKQGQP